MSDDIVREFLVESAENLDSLDRELVLLEKDALNKDRLSSVFRTIHTIKGTCGFLGFSKLEHVAHAAENLLSKLREGLLTLTPEIATALLQTVDAIRQMLESIDGTGVEGERDDTKLVETLTALYRGTPAAAPAAPAEIPAASATPSVVGAAPPATPPPVSPVAAVINSAANLPANLPANPPASKPATFDDGAAPVPNIGEILVSKGVVTKKDIEAAMKVQQEGDPRHVGEILVARGVAKPEEIVDALQKQQVARAASSGDSSIRVDVTLLDKVMNLVGELVLARNQVQQFAGTLKHPGLSIASQHLSIITSELQERVMKTRMQPVGTIWSKFPRTVRDVATSCGKKVRIEMEGQETELDKTIIEAIKDPLTHLVRNSVDHGIESPEKRAAVGKEIEGILKLRAYHQGGQVNIEIEDDGAGLDAERIRAKAIQKGLLTEQQNAKTSEREAMNLIFMPGFSTAETVTNVSGRGVGMDVVKTNIEKIGGTVDLQSEKGSGTIVRMKIPLTLAIIPALMITTCRERYAIPQVNVLELVRVTEQKAGAGIEYVHGAPVYRLRGRLLPLVYLDQALGLRTGGRSTNTSGTVTNIVVAQAQDSVFGLVVDEVNDTEEIVVKPLGEQLKDVKSFAGATIVGDGTVTLILDIPGIAQAAQILDHSRQTKQAEGAAVNSEAANRGQSLLLVRMLNGGQAAVPLELIERLEEFPRTALERIGKQTVVQYREMAMPLVELDACLTERRSRARQPTQAVDSRESATVSVLVHGGRQTQVGLMVERIVDIVTEPARERGRGSRQGVLGTQIIRDSVTEILDMASVLESIAQRSQVVRETAGVRS